MDLTVSTDNRTMRVLAAGSFSKPWLLPAWVRALRESGCDVSCFDWDSYLGGVWGALGRRLLLRRVIEKINVAFVQACIEADPAVVIVYAGYYITPETIQRLSRDYWVTSYHNDDPFGRYGRRRYYSHFKQSLPFYRSHHVYREKNLEDYRSRDLGPVALLRSYYCPWVHYPQYSSDPSYANEVVFVGNGETGPAVEARGYSRVSGIACLVRRGIPVCVHGSPRYWKRHLPRDVFRALGPIAPVQGDEYAKVLTNAKICLAFFNSGNNDQYTRRVFEIPACAGFLLAQRTPVMQELYREGREADYFDSTDELVEKVTYYLRHGDARRRIAQAGHRRCLSSGHDIASRMKQWLDDLGRWMDGSGRPVGGVAQERREAGEAGNVEDGR